MTFGGVDPNNFTLKTVETIYEYCQKSKIHITVIAGFGYKQYDTLLKYSNIEILKNVTNISKYIFEADLIFTSAGRTTYEIASLGTPAIDLAQNERELTQYFASSEYGFQNLGLGVHISKERLFNEFIELVKSKETREHMNKLMNKTNLKTGRLSVLKLIKQLIEG